MAQTFDQRGPLSPDRNGNPLTLGLVILDHALTTFVVKLVHWSFGIPSELLCKMDLDSAANAWASKPLPLWSSLRCNSILGTLASPIRRKTARTYRVLRVPSPQNVRLQQYKPGEVRQR